MRVKLDFFSFKWTEVKYNQLGSYLKVMNRGRICTSETYLLIYLLLIYFS